MYGSLCVTWVISDNVAWFIDPRFGLRHCHLSQSVDVQLEPHWAAAASDATMTTPTLTVALACFALRCQCFLLLIIGRCCYCHSQLMAVHGVSGSGRRSVVSQSVGHAALLSTACCLFCSHSTVFMLFSCNDYIDFVLTDLLLLLLLLLTQIVWWWCWWI